jgi:hypothetical protein
VAQPGRSSNDHVIQSMLGESDVQVESRKTMREIRVSADAPVSKVRPWEGPLSAPIISPKLSIGDVIEKTKV